MITWKDVGVISAMLAFIGVFYGFSLLPDDSTAKMIYCVVFMTLFVLALLWFTPLGNPIKDLITKLRNKK